MAILPVIKLNKPLIITRTGEQVPAVAADPCNAACCGSLPCEIACLNPAATRTVSFFFPTAPAQNTTSIFTQVGHGACFNLWRDPNLWQLRTDYESAGNTTTITLSQFLSQFCVYQQTFTGNLCAEPVGELPATLNSGGHPFCVQEGNYVVVSA